MAMRIINNIPAMTTQRWLNVAGTGLNKSIERLSSGYRINRAADDAAGLAISESFRADIASFKVASRNTSEASSLLQVAEGAMDQVGNMLIRLKELATQAASANVGSSERAKLDAEADALLTEIDRIANVTKYGSSALLDGSFGASKAGAMAVGTSGDDGVIGSTYNAYNFTLSGSGANQGTVTVLGSGVAEGTWYLAILTGGKLAIANGNSGVPSVLEATTGAWSTDTTITFANLGITFTFTAAMTAGSVHTLTGANIWSDAGSTLLFKRTGLSSLNVESADTGTYTFAVNTTANKITLGDGTITQTVDYVAGSTHTFSELGISFVLSGATEGYDDNDLEDMTITVSSTGAAGSTFQIGAENNSDNRIAISIGSVQASTLGINTLDLSTAANAQGALDLVDSAVSTLAGSRGDIGAYMNRLTYAAANLTSTIENVQAAESVIRDVDMAAEMSSFTKYQILLQAGTAMLAQANMAPQQVLALFG
jgi:flagellin